MSVSQRPEEPSNVHQEIYTNVLNDAQKDLSDLLTNNADLEAAYKAFNTIQTQLDEEAENVKKPLSRSRLCFQALIWPTLIFCLVLLIWCLVKPEELMTGFVVALSLFFIAFGLSVFLLNKRAEFSPQAITAAKDFCKSIEGVIHKEKHLRKLDHAVRVLILIDALKVVKRICNLAQTTE